MEIKEEKQKQSILSNIIFTLFCMLSIASMCWCIDSMFLNYRYTNYILCGHAPNYKMPLEYKLVTDGKYWAVKRVKGEFKGWYLHRGKYQIEDYPKEVAYDLFLDSSNAKAYVKSWYDEKIKDSQNLKDFR